MATLIQCTLVLVALLGPTAALASPYEASVPNIPADEHAFVGEVGVVIVAGQLVGVVVSQMADARGTLIMVPVSRITQAMK